MPIRKPDALDFIGLAKAEFTFLARPPFSMDVAREESLLLQYEGHGVAIALSRDPLSYELDAAIWRTAEQTEAGRPYSIGDLIRVADGVAAAKYRRFAATSAESLQHGLAKLAEDLRTYGTPALKNDADFYRKLSIARQEGGREFGRDMKAKSARDAAETAWRTNEWQKAAEAYARISSDLSPAERKRLAYARQKLASSH